jgi:glucose/mannose-6-phosphate isomerase
MTGPEADPLDRPEVLARTDTLDMLGAIAGLSRQLAAAWDRTRHLAFGDAHRAVSSVAILAMGGSAIGADLVRGVFAGRLRVPIVTVRDFTVPAFVGPASLVVAASHSGATAETLGAFETAARQGAPMAVITSGGTLLAVARESGLPTVEIPGGGQPRAAVGWATIALAGLLERAGLLAVARGEIEAAADSAEEMARRCLPTIPTESNPAKQLAWSLLDRLPIVEAGGFLAPVARRWKTQLNENGKTTAAFEELPEAFHNSVVGLDEPDTLRDRLFALFLESPDEDPGIARRIELAAELFERRGIAHEVVRAAGASPLAQVFSTIVLGDFASAYLGLLYGRDPSIIPEITWMKERLAAPADPV